MKRSQLLQTFERFRTSYTRIAYIFLAVWPLVHIQLSFIMEFSPWKFMGWGMYATPYPDFRKVVAFPRPYNCRAPQLTTQGVIRPMIIERGTSLNESFFELYDWTLDGVVRMPTVLRQQDFFEFYQAVKRHHVLNTEASLTQALAWAEPFKVVLVATMGPRVNLEKRIHYWEYSMYRYEQGQARLIGRFKGGPGDVEPIFRIGRELDCI